ncbi:hypothetical protein M8818_001745 [Zalaria obscura]|uniref:Uncharacterized protein n=1 Tax=Zalaria obscura TaxID=2024903 RepID=A0ACC3SJS7_9PEZI
MADMEPFTLVEEKSDHPIRLFDDFADLTSAKTADHDVQYLVALRHANPEMIVTSVPSPNCNLLTFANAGMAIAELDTQSDSVSKWRGYVGPRKRGQQGGLTDVIFFAKYHYTWSGEHFVLYTVQGMQYIIKEPAEGEHVLGHSSATDTLLATIGKWQVADENVVWVYDNYWMKSRELWNSVQKAEWANVILDEGMKKALTSVSEKFFESKEVYEDLGVPWKRGIIFYGPPGNGKTISIKALMHGLLKQKNPIPTLYVKSAPNPYHIRNVFSQARQQSPCLLVLEDIETIVTPLTRSYFFNEVDGLENNDGILMVASTNYLDRLDPGLAKRPSRFDRKYLFPAPNQHERELYCEFWRKKLAKRSSVDFPAKLCPPIARLADGFHSLHRPRSNTGFRKIRCKAELSASASGTATLFLLSLAVGLFHYEIASLDYVFPSCIHSLYYMNHHQRLNLSSRATGCANIKATPRIDTLLNFPAGLEAPHPLLVLFCEF